MLDWASSGGAKIERAKEHISEFKKASESFLQTNPYSAVSQFNEKSGNLSFVVRENHRIPPRLGSIAADAIHNLRCPLDILWLRAFYKGDGGGRTVSFPLNRDPEKIKARFSSIKKPHHKACVDILFKILENKVGYQFLVDLNTLDGRDKHEMPTLGAVCYRKIQVLIPGNDVETFDMEFSDGGYRFLEDGAKLGPPFQATFGDGTPIVDMKAKLPTEIAFGKGEIFEAKPVLETLHNAAQLVDGVCKAFLVAGLMAS